MMDALEYVLCHDAISKSEDRKIAAQLREMAESLCPTWAEHHVWYRISGGRGDRDRARLLRSAAERLES